MENQSVVAILSLAFGLGLLHALDADHIMAVSGLASTRPGLRSSIKFCAHWAIGHGLTLLSIGAGVFLLGMAIPTRLSEYAEHLVGAVLIAIGVWIIWQLARQKAHLHFHRHDDLPRHAHWHVHTKHIAEDIHQRHSHDHSAITVGILHGTAGSAPLLALLPLAKMGSPWIGMGYLAVFGLGVIAAMMLFGGLLGGVYTWLSRRGEGIIRILRATVALSSISFGAYLIYGSA